MKVTKYDKIFSAIYTKNKNENNEVFYANRLKINIVKVIRRLNVDRNTYCNLIRK